jgi:hypothetical protein
MQVIAVLRSGAHQLQLNTVMKVSDAAPESIWVIGKPRAIGGPWGADRPEACGVRGSARLADPGKVCQQQALRRFRGVAGPSMTETTALSPARAYASTLGGPGGTKGKKEMRTAAELEDRIERLEAALHRITTWANAYPLRSFPEPDLQRAHEALMAAGLSLDAVSASAMRHVVTQVGRIASDALGIPNADPDVG